MRTKAVDRRKTVASLGGSGEAYIFRSSPWHRGAMPGKTNLSGRRKMFAHPLSMILSKNQLVGENYIDWKRYLMIVLTAEKLKFMLIEPCPIVLTGESSAEQNEAYDKWTHSDEMARCYILGSISNVMQQKHQSMSTATEIMESLREMFEHQGRQARQIAIRSIMNMRMKHGTPVRDHMLVLIAPFNVAKVLGAEIKSET
ncbi:hypothetical protein DH2020_003806 [Rehmannia glutinosa]|uniref:UBN2_2 domain-containing protein n=1 Tax=Rehmannia glutinosa TaxID=99300 RepID=A0ABR0XMN8_REHGL